MDKQTVYREITAMAPPSGVGGALFLGMELSTIVMVLTALYTVLNIAFLIYRWSTYRGEPKE